MIDTHCHLEQEDYDKNRDEVIKSCKGKLKALISCCADSKDWKITKEIISKHKGFVFVTAGEHPQFIEEVTKEEIEEYIHELKKAAKKGEIIGVGEVGLDYYWIKDPVSRDKQKDMFVKFINLAKELDLPLVVHSRNAYLECVIILEEQGMKGKKVMLHQFGDQKLVPRIKENGWHVSIGPGILKSKNTRKIARDLPLNQILIETDSPWFGEKWPGTPLNCMKAIEKIAEIRKITPEEVEKQTDLNAIKLFGLKLKR